jgi:hypothetical protein
MENKDVKYIVIQDASYNSITEAQKGVRGFCQCYWLEPRIKGILRDG